MARLEVTQATIAIVVVPVSAAIQPVQVTLAASRTVDKVVLRTTVEMAVSAAAVHRFITQVVVAVATAVVVAATTSQLQHVVEVAITMVTTKKT